MSKRTQDIIGWVALIIAIGCLAFGIAEENCAGMASSK